MSPPPPLFGFVTGVDIGCGVPPPPILLSNGGLLGKFLNLSIKDLLFLLLVGFGGMNFGVGKSTGTSSFIAFAKFVFSTIFSLDSFGFSFVTSTAGIFGCIITSDSLLRITCPIYLC
jgi:hypothetical protein